MLLITCHIVLGVNAANRQEFVASDPEARIEQLTAALAEARLELNDCRESLQRSQGTLCALADGLAVVDMQGRVTCLNPIATHLTGWSESESLGRQLADIVRFTDAQGRSVNVLAVGFESLSNGHENIVSLRRRDGHVILVDGMVAQIHDSHARPIGSVVTFRNVTAAARLTRELAFHANHDPLTGLKNRRAFDAQLERAISTPAELGFSHAMLYCDLDQFKVVNDIGGHVAGDELLRQLAAVLRSQLRERDTLARLGGDEFAVLLENCTPTQACRVAEKLRSAIAGFEFAWDGREFRIGTSIGQVVFTDGEKMSAEEIVGIADRMCYVAKAGGRNQVAAHPSKCARSDRRTSVGSPKAATQGT